MVFLVAEIGVNWDGNLDLAKQMMEKAKEIGFNAVKFQSFDENIVSEHPESSRLMKSSISKDNIDSINSIAKSVDIEWFCTPMYENAVDLIEPYVKRFKIRVADGRSLINGNPSELVKKILNTKKPIIASTETNPKNTQYFDNSEIDWLYCVAKYPCEFTDLDFSELSDYSGFSNHCPDIIAPLTAAILGSKIIEVHVTSDKLKDFVDNNVSFDYLEQEMLVHSIKSSDKIKK